MTIRKLESGEPIPYDLLLLADEFIEAINLYLSKSEIYIAEKENRVVAEYTLCKISEEEIEIKNIAVASECQGQGIGKRLLADAEERARREGYKILSVGTGDVMQMQLNFYQRAGFEMFTIKRNFFIEHYPKPIFENGLQLKHMVLLKKWIG